MESEKATIILHELLTQSDNDQVTRETLNTSSYVGFNSSFMEELEHYPSDSIPSSDFDSSSHPDPSLNSSPSQTLLFKRLEKVAEGGMSCIYRGIQNSLQRQVALKESKGERPLFNQILSHESLITGRLEHPNIMPIYDLIHESGTCQVVLKWLEGETLTQRLEEWRDHELEVDRSIPVLLKVCDALEYAHEQKILHRDIKPDNIMICDYGAVYLLDWGIALDMNQREKSKNAIVGTLRYMAPEMLTDNPSFLVDERSDVFLLGATLHEVLTGNPRHAAPIPAGVVEQIQTCAPYQYPPELEIFGHICNRACHKNPDERYKSIRQLGHAIQGAWDTWKQRFLLEQGEAMLEELQSIDRGDYVPETNAHIFQLYMQTRTAFGGYLMFDSQNQEAADGLRQAGLILMRYFLQRGELLSAEWMAEIVQNVPQEMNMEIAQLRDAVNRQNEDEHLMQAVQKGNAQVTAQLNHLADALQKIPSSSSSSYFSRDAQIKILLWAILTVCILSLGLLLKS